MTTSFFGREICKNDEMDVKDARAWLAAVDVGDPLMKEVLSKVAKGHYLRLTKNIDAFIKVLEASKHAVSEAILFEFCMSLNESVLEKVSLKHHSKEIRIALERNLESKSIAVGNCE